LVIRVQVWIDFSGSAATVRLDCRDAGIDFRREDLPASPRIYAEERFAAHPLPLRKWGFGAVANYPGEEPVFVDIDDLTICAWDNEAKQCHD
jgi:hypothetical protein